MRQICQVLRWFFVGVAVCVASATGLRASQVDSSLHHQVGQLLMVGFQGMTPSEEVRDALENYHVGGVILFDRDLSTKGMRNIESPRQLKRLCRSLRALGGDELLIAIDQEGGAVCRLKPKYGFPEQLGVRASEQALRGGAESVRSYAQITAETLQRAGVNVNFVPCVDVNVNPTNPVIGHYGRSFSACADSIYELARPWVEEHQKRQILTSLKHFPGHGSSTADSHFGLTDVTDSWSEQELTPYRQFIEAEYDEIVMVGHLLNTHLDGEYPASLSEATLQGLLRGRLGFEGVIATDDMSMGAIVEHYSLERAVVIAILAGVDLIVLGNNSATYAPNLAQRCHRAIVESVLSGEIPRSRIEQSYRRLQALRQRLLPAPEQVDGVSGASR